MGNYDIAYIFKAIDQFSAPLKKINTAINNFEKQTEKAENRFKKFSSTVDRAGKFLFKSLVLPLAGAAAYAIKNADQFNRMQIRLEAVAGSAANAAKVMESVKQMSMATGLAPEALSDTASRLLAAGYGMDQINEKLKEMSMFAVVSGKDINEISSGLIRMKTVGFAQSRFMARMTQEGIPLVKAFKEYYHLSDKAWSKLAQKRIDFKLIEPVLASMTKEGGAFSESYKKMLMTTGTSIDRIHNALRFIAGDFGEALLKVFGINNGLEGLADKLKIIEPKIKKWLSENPELVKMITYATGLGVALITVAASFNTITKAVIAMRTALLAMAANPAILALLAALTALAKYELAIQGFSFKGLGSDISEIGKLMKENRYSEIRTRVAGGIRQAVDQSALSNAPKLFFGGTSATQQNVNVTMPTKVELTQGGKTVGVIPISHNLGHNMGHV